MKKVYIFIIITAVIISTLAYFFFMNSSICLDKGGSSIYFEKSYYLTHLSEFNNKSGLSVTIPQEEIVARYSESNNCYDNGSYFIKENGKLTKVNREKFDTFLEDYPSTSLLVQKRFFGPSGIFVVSLNKMVCNNYTNSYYNSSDCVNITE